MKKRLRSDEIKNEIARLDGIINEYRPQLAEKVKELDAANQAFTRKEIKIDDLITIRTTKVMLEEALNSLTENRTERASELETVLQAEEHEALIDNMRALVTEGRKRHETLAQLRQVLNDAAESMIEGQTSFNVAINGFRSKMTALVPGFNQDIRWPIINRTIKPEVDAVVSVLNESGITDDDLAFMFQGPQFPALEHEAVITAALNHQSWQIARQREEERLRRKDEVAAKSQADRLALEKRLDEERRLTKSQWERKRAERQVRAEAETR